MGLKLGLSHTGRMFDWWLVQRKVFGPRGQELTVGWLQLHVEKLHDLYSTANMITMRYNAYRYFIRLLEC